MMGEKKKSSHRLSSLFFLGGSSEPQQSQSAASSESSGRLSKVKNRISSAASTSTTQSASATHLTAPEYPPPSPQRRQSPPNQLTIQPVGSPNLEPLEPPPHLDVPSRSSSPGGFGSRPGTPNLEVGNEGKLKKLRRKSGFFGGGNNSSTDLSRAGGNNPLAWIVGHKGKVSYNLTMLLNGEKVRCAWSFCLRLFLLLALVPRGEC